MPAPKFTHGPLVKGGPTHGKVRSRNKNGQWRKKRSDAGLSKAAWNFLKSLDRLDR